MTNLFNNRVQLLCNRMNCVDSFNKVLLAMVCISHNCYSEGLLK